MKILVTTQIVDINDPVLGFFHRWLEEISKEFDEVNVICLKKGESNLPCNVHVYSLGKEDGPSRIKYVTRFFTYIWKLKKVYDGVFVHMNEEYVILGGLFWKIFGKKVVLWRNYKTGSFMTPIAAALANVVCYTSPASYTARYKKSVKMPIGIDTTFFSRGEEEKVDSSVLFLGRMDPVKRVDLFVEALLETTKPFKASMYGDETNPESSYMTSIKEQVKSLIRNGVLELHKGVTNANARDIYSRSEIYVNLTPSGSFDKTIGEAAACECVVVCSNDAMKDALPEECIVGDSPYDIAKALDWVLGLTKEERAKIGRDLRLYIVNNHSLGKLMKDLSHIMNER